MTSTTTDVPPFRMAYEIYQGGEWVASSDSFDDASHYFHMYEEENLGRVRMYQTITFCREVTP